MRKKEKKTRLGYFFWPLIIFFLLYGFYLTKEFSRSLFFKKKERINIVVYGKETYYYSLDREGGINYYLYFPPDLKLIAPGGYGVYRLGGLGKLVFLEKKPDIFKKTFSLATSSFVDFYFYPKKTDIFYGFEKKDVFTFPSLKKLFSDRSNANFFNRLYLAFYFLKTPSQNYQLLPLIFGKDKVFNEEQFFKKTQGYFYKKIYRQEDLNLQLVFHQSFKTGAALSSLIEGEGIRVNDLTQKEKNHNGCLVLENKEKNSQTGLALANFFQCQIKRGETGLYDIILILNKEEDSWWY